MLFVVLMIWQTWGPCKGTSFLLEYCRVLAWVLQMKQTQGPSRGTRLSWWGASWLPAGDGTESRCTLPDGVRKCDFSSQWQRGLGKWLAHIKGTFLNILFSFCNLRETSSRTFAKAASKQRQNYSKNNNNLWSFSCSCLGIHSLVLKLYTIPESLKESVCSVESLGYRWDSLVGR